MDDKLTTGKNDEHNDTLEFALRFYDNFIA